MKDKLTPVEAQAHREREIEKYFRRAQEERRSAYLTVIDTTYRKDRDFIAEGWLGWGIIYRDTGWRPE